MLGGLLAGRMGGALSGGSRSGGGGGSSPGLAEDAISQIRGDVDKRLGDQGISRDGTGTYHIDLAANRDYRDRMSAGSPAANVVQDSINRARDARNKMFPGSQSGIQVTPSPMYPGTLSPVRSPQSQGSLTVTPAPMIPGTLSPSGPPRVQGSLQVQPGGGAPAQPAPRPAPSASNPVPVQNTAQSPTPAPTQGQPNIQGTTTTPTRNTLSLAPQGFMGNQSQFQGFAAPGFTPSFGGGTGFKGGDPRSGGTPAPLGLTPNTQNVQGTTIGGPARGPMPLTPNTQNVQGSSVIPGRPSIAPGGQTPSRPVGMPNGPAPGSMVPPGGVPRVPLHGQGAYPNDPLRGQGAYPNGTTPGPQMPPGFGQSGPNPMQSAVNQRGQMIQDRITGAFARNGVPVNMPAFGSSGGGGFNMPGMPPMPGMPNVNAPTATGMTPGGRPGQPGMSPGMPNGVNPGNMVPPGSGMPPTGAGMPNGPAPGSMVPPGSGMPPDQTAPSSGGVGAPQGAIQSPLNIAFGRGGTWDNANQYDSLYVQYGNQFGVDPSMLKAMAVIESNAQMIPNQGGSGAYGIMQIKQSDWGWLADQMGVSLDTPEGQVAVAAAILGQYGNGSTPEERFLNSYYPTACLDCPGEDGATPRQYLDDMHNLMNEINSAGGGSSAPAPAPGASGGMAPTNGANPQAVFQTQATPDQSYQPTGAVGQYGGNPNMQPKATVDPASLSWADALVPNGMSNTLNSPGGPYGYKSRTDLPYYGDYMGWDPNEHTGWDIPTNNQPTEFNNLVSGTVVCYGSQGDPGTGTSSCGAYPDDNGGVDGSGSGNISIKTPDGALVTYGHAGQSYAQLGGQVSAGTPLGVSGSMNSYHVHVEVMLPVGQGGEYVLVDPSLYFGGYYCQYGYCPSN